MGVIRNWAVMGSVWEEILRYLSRAVVRFRVWDRSMSRAAVRIWTVSGVVRGWFGRRFYLLSILAGFREPNSGMNRVWWVRIGGCI